MGPKEIVAYNNATLTQKVDELTAKLNALMEYLGRGIPVKFRMIPKDTWVVEEQNEYIDYPSIRTKKPGVDDI